MKEEMHNFSTILVALDLSSMDEKLVRYAHLVAEKFDTDKIYFVHIVPDFSMPKQVDLEFKKRFAPETPVDELAIEKMHEVIDPVFNKSGDIEIHIEAIEGKPYQKLVQWTTVKNSDLVITGKKINSEGSGITARRMARKIHDAAVLFVTEKAPQEVRRFLVPVDFSDNSARALQATLGMCRNMDNCEISVVYVVDYPPTGFYLSQDEYAGFNKMLKDTAQDSFDEFIHAHNISNEKISFYILENTWYNISKAIVEHAEEQGFDMIVLGAHGHSAFESFMFGSVTEKVVNRNAVTPVLIVR